ncbi:MAG TPA: CHAT domain-containing protein [Pyrinomonadaceae bacterium]|nr:CHAT domain-containing protein [Pyrinomonadaceae bacterium]
MNEMLKNKEVIRDYLLCRISDEEKMSEIEELLFSDDEFCAQVESSEDEIINQYVLDELSAEDKKTADEFFFANNDRKWKLELTQQLRQKAIVETVKETKTSGFFETLKNLLRKPAFLSAFAVLAILFVGVSIFILTRQDSAELAELQTIYQKERPTESRISSFEYAPQITVRGNTETDTNKNKLRLIETKLLEALDKNPTAKNFHALGVFYLTQAKFADAIKNFEKAVQLVNKTAKYYNDLGSAYFELAKSGEKSQKLENLARANEAFSKAFELNSNLLETLFNKSLTLQELNLPNQAKESWNLYLQKDSTSKWADEARKNLEKIQNQQSSLKKKEQVLEDFLAAFRNGDEKFAWKIHNETKGMFNSVSLGSQLTRRILEARKSGDEIVSKESLEALQLIGKLERERHADFFFAELADFYAKVENEKVDKLLEAKNLWLEGYKSIREGKYEKSIELFDQSKSNFLKLGNEFEANISEIWAAQMLPDVSKIDESRKRLNTLIETGNKRNFKILLPTSFYWLCISQWIQKEMSQSIISNKKAIQIAEETENIYQIQTGSERLSYTYIELTEFDKSLTFISKAIENEDLYYVNSTQTWRNLFTATQLLEKFPFHETTVYFAKESVDLSRQMNTKTSIVNSSLQNLTIALGNNKQFNEALKYADESNSIALSREESPENIRTVADTFLTRADLKNKMQNCSEAISDFDKSLEYYGKIPQTTFNLYNVRKGKLLCLQKLNKTDEFQIELETVLKLAEENRQNIRKDSERQAFFANEQIIYDAAISDALKRNDAEKAFEFAETSKARSLLDFIKADKPIAELENEFSAVAKPLTLEEIRTRMPENVLIVKYAVLDDKLAIWTVGKNKFEFVERRISVAKLEKLASEFRQAILARQTKENLNTKSRELYDILIPKNLDIGKTICLIPDKSLNLIPFAALISESGKYLIEDFAVFYSPSVSVFVLASENAKSKESVKNETILSIGNPSFDRTENANLADLPQAETEAKEIAKDYPTKQVFTGEQATKEVFLNNLEAAEVVHFAGHFVVNEQSSANSKLLFAGGDLRSFELSEKRLKRAKLVVLSACETGGEKFFKGEGAIGIARTFLAMGTPIVAASSWKVDSEATQNLMVNFHKNRRNKNLSSVASLREAQLEMLKTQEFNAPYFWSAFNLVGGFANY